MKSPCAAPAVVRAVPDMLQAALAAGDASDNVTLAIMWQGSSVADQRGPVAATRSRSISPKACQQEHSDTIARSAVVKPTTFDDDEIEKAIAKFAGRSQNLRNSSNKENSMTLSRPSGRAVDALRTLRLTRDYTKHAEGSVLIECGDTKVICTASIEEKVPGFLKGKGQGWLTAEYGMLPRSTHSRMDREAARASSPAAPRKSSA
jgi:hypothetical protein